MSDKTESSTTRSRSESLAPPARQELDLSAESVITIQPDGRIHLFGITPAAVEVLASIPCADPDMSQAAGPHAECGQTEPAEVGKYGVFEGDHLMSEPINSVPMRAVPKPAPVSKPPLASDASSCSDDLEVLIRARYPIIYVVTWEEERIEQRLYEIARRRNKTLHIWTCSQGLVRYGAEVQQRSRTGSGNTCEPMAALDTVLAHVDPAIFVFKDLHDHLDVRLSQANMRTVRRLRDAAAALRDSYKTIVLVSPIMKIPLELSKDVAVIEYGTPGVSDFNALLDRIIEDVKDKPQISITLDAEGRERLIHAARGLTLKEAENVFAKTLVIDGKLDAEDIGVVFSEKQQIIRKSGTLEYYESHDRFADVAGLDNLKEWLRKRSAGLQRACQPVRAARAQGRHAPGHSGLRQEPLRQGRFQLVEAAPAAAGYRQGVRQPGRLQRGQHAAGHPDCRKRGPGHPLGRRDRQGFRRTAGLRR